MKRFIEKRKKFIKDERGAVAILCAVIMVILLGFAALAIDYGLVYYRDAQLQAAVDIAARAASRTLANEKDDETLTDEQKRQRFENVAAYYLEENGFPQSVLTKYNVTYNKDANSITIDARSKVDLNFARVFGQQNIPIAAATTAQTDVKLEGGYEYIVDVVFVIDLSGSMYMGGELDARMRPMYKAVNRTMDSILKQNPKNRVGIVVFSDPDECRTLLEMRTRGELTEYKYGDSKVMYYDYPTVTPRTLIDGGYIDEEASPELTAEGVPIYFAIKRKGDNMHAVSTDSEYHNSEGSTDTQRGIYQGVQTLLNSRDDGISRNPVIFILSDGEATWGDIDYCNPGTHWAFGTEGVDSTRYSRDITAGNGGPDGLVADVGKYTIQTAIWAKQQIQEGYENRNAEGFPTEAQIFTLGFTLDRATHRSYATYVLNPEVCINGEGSGYEDEENVMREPRNNVPPGRIREVRDQLKDYIVSDPNAVYNEEYYEANNQETLDEMMANFASTVVAPTKHFKTYLTE